jgi:hypothetical protein
VSFCRPTILPPYGICIPILYKDAVKIVGKNLICQDDTECKNKETRNFCIRSPKPDMEYGVCADSISEAQNLIFNIFYKSKLTKDNFWEMHT